MDIVICVSISDDGINIAKAVAPGFKGRELTDADIENGVIHNIVADVEMVKSVVIMRPHDVGPSFLRDSGKGYLPDESTRQER